MSHDHMAHMNASEHAGHVMDHSMHTGMNHGGMDHGSMDHGSMDHGSMDHGSHGAHAAMDHSAMGHAGMDHQHAADHASGGHHGMMMFFHGGCVETILFEPWKISTPGGLIGSMIGIFIMAALYEGLKYYREYLFWKTYNALQYRSVSVPQDKSVVGEDNRVVQMVGEVVHKQPPTMLSWMHAFQTFLHIIQIVLSYFLMLIFMTYNTWLCVAVVLGAAVGYFLFGWKKSVVVDVTEHCH